MSDKKFEIKNINDITTYSVADDGKLIENKEKAWVRVLTSVDTIPLSFTINHKGEINSSGIIADVYIEEPFERHTPIVFLFEIDAKSTGIIVNLKDVQQKLKAISIPFYPHFEVTLDNDFDDKNEFLLAEKAKLESFHGSIEEKDDIYLKIDSPSSSSLPQVQAKDLRGVNKGSLLFRKCEMAARDVGIKLGVTLTMKAPGREPEVGHASIMLVVK